MLGELTDRQIDEVLRSETTGHLASVSDGWPYVVPVSYVFDGESNSVYIHSAEGKKLEAMRSSPRVCFEVEQIRTQREWRSVVARGTFEPLWRDTDGTIMRMLVGRFAASPPSATTAIEVMNAKRPSDAPARPIVYRIRLERKSGRFETP